MTTTAGADIKLTETWKEQLAEEFSQPYMAELKAFLRQEYQQGKTIYPRGSEYFAALNLTPFPEVKVVILGQDPYHGRGQAHGLCFSVPPGMAPPPSLQNIFRELHDDLGISPPGHGLLQSWAEQGVLLLNSVLTVEHGRAGSHANHGWETFTDRVIERLATGREHLAFVLWGTYAQKKGQFIDRSRHLVLTAPHPSPFSADRGFFGSRPFSKINRYRVELGLAPVRWDLPRLTLPWQAAAAGRMPQPGSGRAAASERL